MLYIHYFIYVRSGTTETQTQGLLDVPSENSIVTQALMKKLIFLLELFLILLVTLMNMK